MPPTSSPDSTASGLGPLATRRIGFLGCGAMASALAGGLRAAGLPASAIRGADPVDAAREAFTAACGADTHADNAAVAARSDIVVVAVKPGAVAAALGEAAGETKPLWISIAAGVPLRALEEALPSGARVIRAMPNTPALVGAAATAFTANREADEADRGCAAALFGAVGTTWECPNEELLDAVTGLSGSGPAYVFVILEALADAGVRQGLPREAAQALASQTVYGAAKLAIESGRHPASLKDQVASPGGTTIAGLDALEAAGLRAALYRAVDAATRRSRELSPRTSGRGQSDRG